MGIYKKKHFATTLKYHQSPRVIAEIRAEKLNIVQFIAANRKTEQKESCETLTEKCDDFPFGDLTSAVEAIGRSNSCQKTEISCFGIICRSVRRVKKEKNRSSAPVTKYT